MILECLTPPSKPPPSCAYDVNELNFEVNVPYTRDDNTIKCTKAASRGGKHFALRVEYLLMINILCLKTIHNYYYQMKFEISTYILLFH